MAKKLTVLAVLSAFVLALLAVTALGKAEYDERAKVLREKTDKVTAYSFPKVRNKPLAWGDLPDPYAVDATAPAPRSPLGAAQSPSGISSPGFEVVGSYNDDQYFPGGNHLVDWRGDSAWIHFIYGMAQSPTGTSKTGYNVYDAHNGDWPRGAGVGATIQPADQEGLWPNMDVSPSGMVVVSCVDDAGGSRDNHYYWQAGRFSAFFSAGCIIPASQYNVNFLDNTFYLGHPRIEVQIVGSDTITHTIAVEETYTVIQEGSPFDIRANSLNYFRRAGMNQVCPPTWTGPVTLDSMNSSSETQSISNGGLAASRVSSDIAVSYTHNHEQAWVNNQRYDVEVFLLRSPDAGETWPELNTGIANRNLTSYSRVDPSACAFINTQTLYDTDGDLHVIWTAAPTVENVYDDPIFFWGDFSASLYHWSDRVAGPNLGGTIVKAHNADWGIDFNTQVCGFGSPGMSYIGCESVSECDGRLYIFFSQWLDALGNWRETTPPYAPQINDCASGGFSHRYFAANAELAMVVSSTLDGLLWDAARNLTNTYTEGCDSAGYGGVCMHDSRGSSARYGMDVSQWGDPLTWPGDEYLDPTPADSPAYSGTWFNHVFYTEDHFPAPGWRDVDTYGQLTLNPLRWLRVPCVNPVEAPQIAVNQGVMGYPEYVNHGVCDTITVTVTNDGNVPLTVTTIGNFEDASGPSNWLDNSAPGGMVVGAGVNNTNTFDMYVNKDGVVNSPGTVVPLDGHLYLLSDAANFDSLTIDIINFIVADSVIGLAFDTVSTTLSTRGMEVGEYIHLVVTNTGEMGFNGNNNNGTLNMDYVEDGGECNIGAATYLYSGGPMIIRKVDDTTFVHSQAMFQNAFSTDQSFKRVLFTPSHATIVNPNYDGFFTGTAVNFDTTLGVERTYYGPLGGGDSSDFIVVKTQIFSMDGSEQSPLAIAEAIDWDVPGGIGDGSINTSGVIEDHDVVYQRGADTGEAQCQSNTTRYGTTKLLGYFLQSEFAGDSCVGTCSPYGAYADRNDTLFEYDDTLQPARFWEMMGDNSGIHEESSGEETDLHMIMTYVHDYTLPANDTFTVYSVVTTVHDGDADQLSGNLDAAFEWYREHLRPGCDQLCGCCEGLTGNVDGDPDGLVDIGDLTALIAYLYIPPNPVPTCLGEANIDGDANCLVDIGDLTALIAYLYIPPNPSPAVCFCP
jgi:hypothetical protein